MDQPNIVWITLDSVRADHTTMAGYRRDTTPNLERIAALEQGNWFSQCFAHAKWTAPSTASILTGTYPTRHGVGVDEWRLDEMRKVPTELMTVPERLQNQGYRTACISSNSHISEGTGLTRGFDYHELVTLDSFKKFKGVWALLRFALEFRHHSSAYTLDHSAYNHTVYLDEIARHHLKEFAATEEPFFLYLHNNDPHHPYTPPITYQELFTEALKMDTDAMLTLCWKLNDNIYEFCEGKKSLKNEELAAIQSMYDATLAYVDEWVGDLFEYIKSLDAGPTIFIVTADHGDLFNEYGLFGHNFVLNDALLRVPLVVHGLDGVTRATDGIVQHIDLVQTLLENVGAMEEGLQGINLQRERRPHAIAQRGKRDKLRDLDLDHVSIPLYPDGFTCLRTNEFKFEYGVNKKSSLYRLPNEERDVSDQYPDRVEAFRDILESWLIEEGAPVSSDQERANYADDMKQQLKDMGYL